jgi:hypothetical protein
LHERIRIAAVTLLKFLPVLAALTLVVAVVRISLMFRARAMSALAARWGLRYVGPRAFRWWGFPPLPKTKPPVPVPFSLTWWPANKIRQVWNVIEGQQEGVSVLIFDSFIGIGKSGVYRTFFTCKTEQSPFGIDASPANRVVQSRGWTILYRSPPFLEVPWATWTMGIKRLEGYLKKLRVGSPVQA